jgi:cellulose synthase/poly-beta-1,6-N-acetylglucosamine synthase-like glycosyltransferase
VARVSVIIPSRNERFLPQTVADLLAKAGGDVEIIACLDGYWPTPAMPDDPRLKILHRGRAQGMRPAINGAVQMATGAYLLKSDAHCLWDEGYDLKLQADYLEDNWILTPRRYALDADNWRIEEGNRGKYPVDYEYLSYGLERPDDPTCGFHGTAWTARREERRDVLLDADMSSQGSAWFMSRKHWDRQIKALDIEKFGSFYGESQEIGLQTQLAGGAMMRTKNTWYAHLRKGKEYGRGYALGPNGHRRGAGLMVRMCMLDQWPGQVRSLQSLIEEFAPVPTWPADLDKCFAEARQQFAVAA